MTVGHKDWRVCASELIRFFTISLLISHIGLVVVATSPPNDTIRLAIACHSLKPTKAL